MLTWKNAALTLADCWGVGFAVAFLAIVVALLG